MPYEEKLGKKYGLRFVKYGDFFIYILPVFRGK
jgi:hypothetical protein